MFHTCLERGQYAAAMRQDSTGGPQAGVTGTPAGCVGVTEPHASTVTALRQRTGAQPAAALQAALNSLLAEQK